MPLNTTIVINKSRFTTPNHYPNIYSIQNQTTPPPKKINREKTAVDYALIESTPSAITLKIKSAKKPIKIASDKKSNIYDFNNMAIPKEMKKKLDTSQWLSTSSIIVPSYRIYIERKQLNNEADVYS